MNAATKPFKREYPLKAWKASHREDGNYPTFSFPGDAKEAGFQSASYWKSKGRVVINPYIPSAVVPTGRIGKTCDLSFETSPYLAKDGNYYIIASDYFYYYSEDRTVTKNEAKLLDLDENNNLITKTATNSNSLSISYSFPSPPSPFHYALPECGRNDVTTYITKTLGEGDGEKKKAYIPANYDPNELPEWMKKYADHIAELFHILHHRRIIEQLGKDEFVNLKAAYLETSLGRNENRNWIWDILKPHLLGMIIETDHTYIFGKKSFGYRLIDKYRTQKMVCRKINAPVKKVQLAPTLPVHKFLVKNLERIELDLTWETDQDERVRDCGQRLADKDLFWTVKDEFGHRFHSNLTNAPRRLKSYLLVSGQHLVEIDLSNSQPLWAAFEIAKRKLDGCDQYIDLCSRGKFYDHFTQYGFTRNEVKDEFRESILFKRNGYASKIKTHFKRDFPQVNQFWEKCKAKDPKTFAKLLQRQEAKFMIYSVVDRLRKIDPSIFVSTIHDSILTTPDQVELVKQVITQEAQELGLTLTIKVKHYGQQN